jgi:large subunit ribosomal protein L29
MTVIEDIRTLNDDQLNEELENVRREVFNLRFRAVTRQLSNTNEVGVARRKVAQVLTVLRERQLAEAQSEEQTE